MGLLKLTLLAEGDEGENKESQEGNKKYKKKPRTKDPYEEMETGLKKEIEAQLHGDDKADLRESLNNFSTDFAKTARTLDLVNHTSIPKGSEITVHTNDKGNLTGVEIYPLE